MSSRTGKKKQQIVQETPRDTPVFRGKSAHGLTRGTRRKLMQHKEQNAMVTTLKEREIIAEEINFLRKKKWSNLRTRTLKKVQWNHRYIEKGCQDLVQLLNISLIMFFFPFGYSLFVHFSRPLTELIEPSAEPSKFQASNIFSPCKSIVCLRTKIACPRKHICPVWLYDCIFIHFRNKLPHPVKLNFCLLWWN